MKLRSKLTLIFVLIGIVPLIVLAWLALDNGNRTIERQTVNHLTSINLLRASELQRWINDKKRSIKELAQRPLVRRYAGVLSAHGTSDTGHPRAKRTLLEDHLDARLQYGEFTELFVLCPGHGIILASTDHTQEGKFRENMAYFVEGRAQTYIQPIYYSTTLEQPTMMVGTPIENEQGELIAVLAGRLDLSEISRILEQGRGLTQTGDTYLVNTFNFFVTEPRFGRDYALKKTVHTKGVKACLSGRDGVDFYKDYRGVPVIGAYKWLGEYDLGLLTEVDQSEAYAPISRLKWGLGAFTLAVVFITACLGFLFARTITRPVYQLLAGTREIGRGNLKYQVGTSAKDEIGELSRSFDRMTQVLQSTMVSRDELIKERNFSDSLIESLPGVFYLFDQEGRFQRWNKNFEDVTEYPPEEIIPISPLALFTGEDQQHIAESIDQVFAEGRASAEACFTTKTGRKIPYTFTGTVVQFDSKPYLIGMGIDNTIQKRIEADLKQRKRELMLRNQVAEIFLTVADEGMYTEVLQVILTGMDSQFGVFGYIDQNGALVVPTMTRSVWEQCGVPGKDFVFSRETWGSSSWVRAITEKRLNYTNQRSTLTPEGHIPIDNHVSLPLVHRERAIGLIQVANKKGGYSEEDVQLLKTISNAISPVLNARLERDRFEKMRQKYETDLKVANENLRRSNKELEQFAYVASHDLQEPLRMVSSYTQLLEQKYDDQLDDKAKKYIYYAVDGAGRMQGLINDLLTYSRVNTKGADFESVDTHAALGQALVNLKAAIAESGALVTNDDLPEVMADPTQISRVFTNLIANAIKFRGDSTPRVHMSAKARGKKWVFSVKDNGIGIDLKYKNKIFIIFQRLHTRNEYPGTGIGLALCKRIIERHGGKIWFDSEPGHGTTFYFTLPRKRKEKQHHEQ